MIVSTYMYYTCTYMCIHDCIHIHVLYMYIHVHTWLYLHTSIIHVHTCTYMIVSTYQGTCKGHYIHVHAHICFTYICTCIHIIHLHTMHTYFIPHIHTYTYTLQIHIILPLSCDAQKLVHGCNYQTCSLTSREERLLPSWQALFSQTTNTSHQPSHKQKPSHTQASKQAARVEHPQGTKWELADWDTAFSNAEGENTSWSCSIPVTIPPPRLQIKQPSSLGL